MSFNLQVLRSLAIRETLLALLLDHQPKIFLKKNPKTLYLEKKKTKQNTYVYECSKKNEAL